MKASFVDLRKKSAQIVRALERNESVTVSYRGRVRAVMTPLSQPGGKGPRKGSETAAKDHAAFGLWADRKDLADVARHVRSFRKGRLHAL